MIYKYFKQFSLFLFLASFSLVGQNSKEKQFIIKDYDLTKLENLKEEFSTKFREEKKNATLLATQKGWKLKYKDPKGSYYELMRVSEEGTPLYYKTYNVDAAISTRTNYLHNNGGLGLNVEGQGMTAYVWDGGIARATHQEYDGDGGDDRFSVGDLSTELNFHAAHVMGTIISSGFEPAAKGMAPKAKGIGNDWNNDLSEATLAASNGMLVSNHSYGIAARDDDNEVQIPSYYFGAYISTSRNWDNLMYNAPYYLMVVAAGNDGNDNTANEAPLEGGAAFDKLTSWSTTKNSLVIANGQDALIDANGALLSVTRNTSSSQGPTDDLRIKPDIMGNGSSLYSTYDSADNAYNTISGTSMASPNVTGSLLLLQQYYKETYGSFMKAATLKGLALHTADDTDMVGPDANTGWGLMNTKVAAETITKKGFESWISEEVLTNGNSYSVTVNSDGLNPLLASISWTDKPGVVSTGIVNDATASLVNDLDIKITRDGVEYKPWRLTGVSSNEKGDNLVDPYERVDVTNPTSGEYTITVTHKGTLAEAQNFSLIVTGVAGEFTFVADTSEQAFCSNEDAVFNFEYRQAVAGTTQFSATGAPEGVSVAFSKESLSADGSFNITFGNLSNVPAGSYYIEVKGDNGNEIQKRIIRLIVLHQNFDNNPSELEFPVNGQKGLAKKVSLAWKTNLNAENYVVELSNSPSFSSILYTDVVTDRTIDVSNLETNSVYYWRVKATNKCGEGAYTSAFSFQTGVTDCTNIYTATDFSTAGIDETSANATAIVPISITDNLFVNKVMVTVDITHPSMQELTLSLQAPESIGGASVVILSNACGNKGDMSNTTFDDDAGVLFCEFSAPAITGTIAPDNNMSAPFLGKNALGDWKLVVQDNSELNGGQINAFSITICSSVENTSVPTFSTSNLVLNGSLNYVITATDMNASTASETEEQQIYTLVELAEKGTLKKEGTELVSGDTFTQADITGGKITFTNTETTSFTDQFKVNVTNDAKGWLANQTVTVQEGVLKTNEFSLNDVSLWPNPVKGILNVKLNNAIGNDVIISLFDLQGRKIFTSVNKSTTNVFTKEIDTKNLSSGVYLLGIEQGSKKVTKKIIITK
ncbi:S8 family serine peptidase [Polaribacter sp. 20A6]|uniref:S8 family serine peptidase n=1 Tax=Polaribacter sp. 20A6 TaxID=2687289 RepID=UPI0013FE264E|nr:S8 family serine peptidase [Polaribacter sp. 20A6]